MEFTILTRVEFFPYFCTTTDDNETASSELIKTSALLLYQCLHSINLHNILPTQDTLETTAVTQIESENVHTKVQQKWNKPFEESFTSTTTDYTFRNLSTAQLQNVNHRFPRVRTYTKKMNLIKCLEDME